MPSTPGITHPHTCVHTHIPHLAWGLVRAAGSIGLCFHLSPERARDAVGNSLSLSLSWMEGWHWRLSTLPLPPLRECLSSDHRSKRPAVCIWNWGARGYVPDEGIYFIFKRMASWKMMGNSKVFCRSCLAGSDVAPRVAARQGRAHSPGAA